MATDSRNIYQRLLAVASKPEVIYVKKTVESGSSGKRDGVSRDWVVAQIKKHLFDEGIYVSTSQVCPGTTTRTEQKSQRGNTLVQYVGMYETSFINVNDTSDRHVVRHEAHGNDYGDKSPGKAATYAEKLNLLKGLFMETGISDESRTASEWEDTEEGDPPPTDPEIKTPQSKSAKAAAAAEPAAEPAKKEPAKKAAKEPEVSNEPASKGLIEMVKNEAKAKNLTAKLEANLEKRGLSWSTLTKTAAASIRSWIADQPEPTEG